MGDTRGFRTHEGILADVLVTAWILSIGMAAVAAAGHWEVALVLGVLFTLNVWLAVMGGDEVRIEYTSFKHPVKVLDESDPGWTYVVMPVMKPS